MNHNQNMQRINLIQTRSAHARLERKKDTSILYKSERTVSSFQPEFRLKKEKKHAISASKQFHVNARQIRILSNLILVIFGISVTWTIIGFSNLTQYNNGHRSLRKSQSSLMSPIEIFPELDSVAFPFTSSSNRALKIPIPLPTQKASIIIMNYSRPRMIRESRLMPTLLAHPNVGEVILLHANSKTSFKYEHEKVINIDATQENDDMGLSLRFFFSQMAKYEWIIHVDDDMEFDIDVLSKIFIEFNKNTKRIVGRFGRQLDRDGWFNGYSSTDTHKWTDVVLTKLMIMERELCSYFFEYAHLVWEDIVLKQGEGPMWNGEDIFMSLVANHVYGGKGNYAMDWLDVKTAPSYLKDYDYGKLDISGGYDGYHILSWEWWQSLLRRNRHYSYRGLLWQAAESRLAVLSLKGNVGEKERLLTPEELEKLKI